MRATAIVVDLPAMGFGGGCLMWAGLGNFWNAALYGWMPLFVGGGLFFYALFKDSSKPFSRVARFAVWFLLFGFAAYVVFVVYIILFSVRIH